MEKMMPELENPTILTDSEVSALNKSLDAIRDWAQETTDSKDIEPIHLACGFVMTGLTNLHAMDVSVEDITALVLDQIATLEPKP